MNNQDPLTGSRTAWHRKTLALFFKSAVTIFFIVLVLHLLSKQNVTIASISRILSTSSKIGLAIVFVLNYAITALLAVRWRFLLSSVAEGRRPFLAVWKMTLIGLFFNIFLPTGAGGDVAKIIYLTRDQQAKLKLAVSVLFDRFIGSSTIISMAVLGVLISREILPGQLKMVFFIIFLLLLLAWLVILWRALAISFVCLLPEFLKAKLRIFYSYAREYTAHPKALAGSFGASFALQLLALCVQFLVAVSISSQRGQAISPGVFFVFIPMIWLLGMVPSLGGLGIREYGYIYFFGKILGNDGAFALSIVNLCLIILQGVLGGIIFLTTRSPGKKE
jgi:uncharacterized protein (TIRG00374 family)